MEIRKVPAAAGAEWLLGAFRLLRKSPLGFGLLALVYAGMSFALILSMQSAPAIGGALQLIFFIIGPLLIAGMIFAAHEVDEGREASPAHLLAAVRSGKAGRVISTLLPQVAVLLVCLALLYVIVGEANVEKLLELSVKLQTEAQTKGAIDPNLMAGLIEELPLGRLFLWLVVVFAIGFGTIFFTLTIVPDMMFTEVRLLEAMKRSYRACTQNLMALLLFLIMGFVVMIAFSVALGILGALAGMIGGDTAMLFINSLGNGVFVAFLAGAMYFAWKQMLGDGPTATLVEETSGVAM
ncbi:MAG: BPSS1780 family membrane protein [Lysobacteraceae bacterium]